MEYKVITSHTLESLQSSVNDFLEMGWQLQGGVCVYLSDAVKSNYYAQAMIKIK